DATACAAAGGPPAVWEITHLGGHKFAPTAVLLPSGYVHARLNAAVAVRALAEARRGQVLPEGNRGRSTWSRAGQAAELAVRAELNEWATTTVSVTAEEKTAGEPEPAWKVVVEHEDGRAYEVFVAGSHAPVARPDSCGKLEGNPLELRVESIDKIR
ncbi:MAG: sucrase ferredoxin, partial [Catenulispora sp.]|nr:sucrase ferredoxin [Catenulispora sp.]